MMILILILEVTFDDGLLTVEDDRIGIGIGGNTIETTSSGSVGIGDHRIQLQSCIWMWYI